MAAKAEVSKETPDRAEIESLLANWDFPGPLTDFSILFGGYSGTSLKVVGADGSKFVLKINHGYDIDVVEAQARVAVYARAKGFSGACTAYALRGKPATFAVARPSDGTPCCLLSWVDGVAADKVIAAGKVESNAVLMAVGGGLGCLHRIPPPAGWDAVYSSLRTYETSGACDLRLHVSSDTVPNTGESSLLGVFKKAAVVKEHPFLPFYKRQLAALEKAIATPGLPDGLLHGDPFLDNVLVDAADGHLSGFVDLEDFTVGPLLFDVACCASACCFRAKDNALDIARLRALMRGYAAERPLAPAEVEQFVAFMRVALLCNCTWRFKNFNIDHREMESCERAPNEPLHRPRSALQAVFRILLTPPCCVRPGRDAHCELQERIEGLEDDITIGQIEAVLKALPSAPKEAVAGAATAACSVTSTETRPGFLADAPKLRPVAAAAVDATMDHLSFGGRRSLVYAAGVGMVALALHRIFWGGRLP
jgi:hypothetical protein